jgi:hypothetical protein
MAWFARILVEPLYRAIYGPPLPDSLPFLTHDTSEEPAHPGRDGLRGGGCAVGDPACRGLVVVADGVGGFDLLGTGLRYVMGAEAVPYAIRVVPWGHGLGRWFADLSDVANRDTKAVLVAQAVRGFLAQQPNDPVFLIAKSGGSGVIVKALERLGESSVERVLLLAPALSPQYDLTEALRAIRRELVVFWSPFDLIILGMGTRVFGTVDRVRTASAGLMGFRLPDSADGDTEQGRQYAKLHQVRWAPRMAVTGYLGGHLGPDSPIFLRNYVVPLLRTGQVLDC